MCLVKPCADNAMKYELIPRIGVARQVDLVFVRRVSVGRTCLRRSKRELQRRISRAGCQSCHEGLMADGFNG